MEVAAVSCPICLASSVDERLDDESATASADASLFVRTPCGHVFCKECIERVVLKPRDGGIPTRAPCPMCRKTVNLFDLVHATDKNSFVYDAAPDTMSSWTIASSQFQQRSLRGIPNILQRMTEEKGAIEGFGITFVFREPAPLLRLENPLRMAFDCNWMEVASSDHGDLLKLDSIAFDRTCFHERSMTFCGGIRFANPVRGEDDYFYEELDCLLHFSGGGHYVRRGELRWKLASSAPNESFPFPLDGTWEVQWSNGSSKVIHVQKHFWTCYGLSYRVALDGHHRPSFTWSAKSFGEPVEQTSNQQIWPGTRGPEVGEVLNWTTTTAQYKRIVWKRLATSLDNCWRSFGIDAVNFVYQKCNQQPNGRPLGPTYQANTLWGNTFCQKCTVGLASYHFLEPDASGIGNHRAYISYESPRAEAWPLLDNDERVPPRVPFRNISFQPETRTFRGDICWEEDYGTTWMGESKWSYEMVFDPTFVFVESGTCTRSGGESQPFGEDLVYVNAAVETLLRTSLETQSTGEYLDVARQWRDNNASEGTLQMLGQIAIAVMGNRESIIDFNL